MVDFYEKITDMQGTLEGIARKIPGFGGYLRKDDRRNADAMLRDHLVLVFEEQADRFHGLQIRLIEASGIGYMEHVQRIAGKLQTFIDRIRTAARGYSGVFDAVKVRDDELNALYAFDNALLAYLDQLVGGLQHMETAIGTDEIAEVLRQLDQIVTEANNTFQKRAEAMISVQVSSAASDSPES